MTKFTIIIDKELSYLKAAYRKFFDEDARVTKKDVATWISTLAAADIEDIMSHDEDED